MGYVTVKVDTNEQVILPAKIKKSIKVIAFHYNLTPGAAFGFWWADHQNESVVGHFYGKNGSGSEEYQHGLVLGDKSLFIGPVGKALIGYSNTTTAWVTVVYKYV